MKQMLHHFMPGLTETVAAGSTNNIALGGTSVETDLVHVRNTRPIQQAGTLSLLTVTVTANSLSSTLTVGTAIGADSSTPGNCSITFSAAQTGTLEDNSNTDDVAASDLYSFVVSAASGTGTGTIGKVGIVWEPDSGSISLLGCNAASSLGIANNGTVYVSVSGFRESGATEVQTQNIVTSAGTWRYLGVGVATVTLPAGTFTFTSRINGVDGNQVLALTFEDELATFVDTSNTDAVASGDLINIEAVTADSPGSGSGGTNYEWFHSQINHTSDETLLLIGGNRETIANNTTLYFAAAGQTNGVATESDAQHGIRFDATSSHLGALSSQTGGGDMNVTLRINGADANQTVFIDVSAGSPDVAIDTSNTDDILSTDALSIEATVPASPSGNCRLQSTSLRLTAPPAGNFFNGALAAQPATISLSADHPTTMFGDLQAQAALVAATAEVSAVFTAAMAAQAAQISADITVAGNEFPFVNGTVASTSFIDITEPIVVNLPADIQPDEALIVELNFNTLSTLTSVLTPAGWTRVFNTSLVGIRTYIFVKKATGSEGATVSFFGDVNPTSLKTGTALAMRVANWSGDIADIVASTRTGGSGTVAATSALSPPWGSAKTLWLWFCGTTPDDIVVSSQPLNFTNLITAVSGDPGSGNAISFARRELETATSEPGTATLPETEGFVTFQLAVRPFVGVAVSAALAAQNASIDGDVERQLDFAGAVTASAATLDGDIGRQLEVTGALASQASSLSGLIGVGISLLSGDLQAQAASLSATIVRQVNVVGTLVTTDSSMTGLVALLKSVSISLQAAAARMTGLFEVFTFFWKEEPPPAGNGWTEEDEAS